MSIYSDYKCGALTEDEYRNECARENRKDRIQREMVVESLEEMCDLMCGAPEDDCGDDQE